MDQEEFFDFESALTNELMETLKRFESQNPQMNEIQMMMTLNTSALRLAASIGVVSLLPKELLHKIFDALYNDIFSQKEKLNGMETD